MRFLSVITIIISLSCHELKDLPTIKVEASNTKKGEEVEPTCILYFEKLPEFIGGYVEMYKYLSKHLKADASEIKLSNKIFVRFDILEDGTVDNVEIIKGAEKSPILRQNLINVFKGMPNWKHGEDINGKAKKMKMTYPIILEFD